MEFYEESGQSSEEQRAHWNCLSGAVHGYFCQFLELLEQPEELYSCCENPEIVCLDGLVMSIENARIREQKLSSPWLSGESNSGYFNFLRNTKNQLGTLIFCEILRII